MDSVKSTVTVWRRVIEALLRKGMVLTGRGASQLETFCGGKVRFDLEEVV